MISKLLITNFFTILKFNKIFIFLILTSIIINHNGRTRQQKLQQQKQQQPSSQSYDNVNSNNNGYLELSSSSHSSSVSIGSNNNNNNNYNLNSNLNLNNDNNQQILRYDAPDDCHYWFVNSNNDVALICNLRTVNSEFDTTNFSVIPTDHTISLTIICNNEIQTKSSLYSNSFVHLIKLKELNIEYCKFAKFSHDILYGLNDIRNLTIRTHNINWQELNFDIETNSFSITQNLERLDLSQNNIWSLPELLFCNLNGLIFLNISENRLQDINELGFRDNQSKDGNGENVITINTNSTNNSKSISSSSGSSSSSSISSSSSSSSNNGKNGNSNLKSISNKTPDVPPSMLASSSSSSSSKQLHQNQQSCSLDLEILDVSYNHFVLLPAYGFGILKRLKQLKLNNNEISMVADRALSGLKNLQILNLSSNKIVALPSELFLDPSQSIQEIYLQNNSISVLSPKLFSNLVQLQALDLSFNQITSMWIDKDTFSGLIRLVLLNLSHNKITKLKPEIFTDLYTLQILNLRYNQLENIEADTFSPMNNLHTLLLSHNKLKYLDAYALNGLYVLSLLSLDNNALIGVHPEAFRNCSSLQDLNLNGNQLKSIPLALRNMRLLRTVDLGENMISLLEEPGFRGLNNLYGLRLIGNYLENITITAFKDLPSLQILNLARNRIQYIEPGAFEMTSSIQAIRLDGNELTDINGLFSNMPSLLWLNISDNKLEHFDFTQIPNSLQWLDLHKNELNELSNRYMLDSHLRLQTLDASFNHLTRVTPNSIPNSIELLFLNDNLISIVEPHSFLNKINLTRVDLYANQITTLDIKALRLLPVSEHRLLPEFYIGGNPFICDCNIDWLQKINQITTRQYPKIMDLETIYCKLLNNRERAYIQLIDAEPKNFLCTYKTHCFALCHCCEFDACDCEMTCPNNCTCFHDQSWSANVVECSNAGYDEMPTNIPMDTTEVYIDGNFLGELSGHSFIGRKNLIVLYANNSNIQTIYNTTFSGLRRLMVLHLEDNKIYRLYGNEFSSLENLRELYLQNNKISYIANGTFSRMRKLEVLRLDGNKLISFEVWQLVLNPYLVEIGLADNMWSCECSYLSKFRNYLQTSSQKIIDGNRVACVYNNLTSILKEKNGTKCTLRDGISTYVRTSEIEDLLPLLLASTCAFIGFFGLILGVFCYRHELRMWAHNNCFLSICYKSSNFVDSYDKDRFYDAYITYSLQDEHFVNQILANTLENNIGYRLCLHYRDFNVNSYIADTIIEAVESSKQAVLVLSKNFLYNEWTRFEFKSAVHELLKRRKKLVFILYGDLPQRDIDSDMRHYLRTNTCIEWDDKKFWQKLRIALPHISQHHRKNHCLTKRSAVNIYATAHDYNSGPPPPPPPDCTKRFDCSNYATIKDCNVSGGGGGRNFSGNHHRFDAVIPTTGTATTYKYNPSGGIVGAAENETNVHLQKNDLNSMHSTIDRTHHHHEYAVPSNCLISSNATNYSSVMGGGGGENNCECNRYSASLPNASSCGTGSNECNQSLTNSISQDEDVGVGGGGGGSGGGVVGLGTNSDRNNSRNACAGSIDDGSAGSINLNFSSVNNLCQSGNNLTSNNFFNNYNTTKSNNILCTCNCSNLHHHNIDGCQNCNCNCNCNNHCNHCISSSPSLNNDINCLEKRIQQNLWA